MPANYQPRKLGREREQDIAGYTSEAGVTRIYSSSRVLSVKVPRTSPYPFSSRARLTRRVMPPTGAVFRSGF